MAGAGFVAATGRQNFHGSSRLRRKHGHRGGPALHLTPRPHVAHPRGFILEALPRGKCSWEAEQKWRQVLDRALKDGCITKDDHAAIEDGATGSAAYTLFAAYWFGLAVGLEIGRWDG